MKPTSLLATTFALGLGAIHVVYGQASRPVQTQISKPQSTAEPTLTGEYNVRAFGAAGDGKTLDSPAINRAILAADAAGGGTVRLPPGTYLSLSIHLRSNITLHLDRGAVLLAAERTEVQRYDAREQTPNTQFQDAGHSYFHNSLIWGEGLQNVSIEGAGEIYGQGLLRDWTREDGFGDKAIALKNCRNVTIRDVTIRHGGWFGILATGVDNLIIDGLKIDTNRDGMDIDCCRNVRVSNCSVNSPTDDGICLKSSYAWVKRARRKTSPFPTAWSAVMTKIRCSTAPIAGARKIADRTHQIRHGIQWRLQKHLDFQLRVRQMPRPGARNRRWRFARRCHHQQSDDARHRQRADIPASGAADARSGGNCRGRATPHQHQQHQRLQRRFRLGGL